MNNECYFSAADPWAQFDLPLDGFDRSLLLNVLFAPAGMTLAMRDVYFFLPTVAAHLVHFPGSSSLLKEAIKRGFVTCRFRAPEDSSFVRALKVIQEQDIAGLVSNANVIARDLDTTMRLTNTAPVIRGWGRRSLAKSFEKMVERYVYPDDAPLLCATDRDQLDFAAKWQGTQDFRKGVIDRALRRSKGRGLTRTWIYAAFAEAVCGISTVGGNAEKLHEAITKHAKGRVDDFLFFNRLLTVCYQWNGACCFGINATFPSFSTFAAYLVSETQKPAHGNPCWSSQPMRSHRFPEIQLPVLDQLGSLPPKLLFDLREGGAGCNYQSALAEWAAHADSSGDKLSEAILKYSETICQAMPNQMLEEWSLSHAPVVLRPVAERVLNLAKISTVGAYTIEAANFALSLFRVSHPLREQVAMQAIAPHEQQRKLVEVKFLSEINPRDITKE